MKAFSEILTEGNLSKPNSKKVKKEMSAIATAMDTANKEINKDIDANILPLLKTAKSKVDALISIYEK